MDTAALEARINDLQNQAEVIRAECWLWYREQFVPVRQQYERLLVDLPKERREELDQRFRARQKIIHDNMIGRIKWRCHAIWTEKNKLWVQLLNLRHEQAVTKLYPETVNARLENRTEMQPAL